MRPTESGSTYSNPIVALGATESDPAQPVIARPRGAAASAYGTIIRRTEAPREIEQRVFSQVTAALEAAEDPQASPSTKAQAIHDNRLLWITLASDLVDPGNAFPERLKANLLSLALWVSAESERVLRDGKSLKAIIDTNKIVMEGLGKTPAEAA